MIDADELEAEELGGGVIEDEALEEVCEAELETPEEVCEAELETPEEVCEAELEAGVEVMLEEDELMVLEALTEDDEEAVEELLLAVELMDELEEGGVGPRPVMVKGALP